MPPINGRPRRWQQRRNLRSAISGSDPSHDGDKQSRQTQPDDDLFDTFSVASFETSLKPDCTSGSDTDGESSREGDAMDHSSFLHDLISQYEEEGPVIANRGDKAKIMIQTEEGKWNNFCNNLTMERLVKDPMTDPVNPVELLKTCHAPTFKAYLDWRCRNSRIKKISSIVTYWKVLSMLYSDKFLSWIDGKVLFDIGNWIPVDLAPKYGLDGSSKNKSGLYTGDLDLILHHHWVLDRDVFSHERLRVQLAVALILAGATATRPGALIHNLYYKNVQFHVFPPIPGSKRARVGMTVTLTKTKRAAGKSRPATFGFHEEDTLLRDPVLYITSLALADGAFENQFNSPADIYDLAVPAGQSRMILPWKEEWRDRPIFRDTEGFVKSPTIAHNRPFSYTKARQSLIKLGRALGYEKQLEWYDLRRGSGKKLNKALTPEERNQSMGHTLGDSSTYVKFYMTDFVAVDFQHIVFGSEPQRDLIELMGRLMRRGDAPTSLTEEQMVEINSDKQLLRLKERKMRVVDKMSKEGWSLQTTPKEGRGAALLEQHSRLSRQVDTLRKTLYDDRLSCVIHQFHASNDGEEIARQLRGVKPSEYLVSSTVHYELPGRARIAKLFSETTSANNRDEHFALRLKLVQEIAQICQQREPSHRQTSKGAYTKTISRTSTAPKASSKAARQGSDTGGAQRAAASRLKNRGVREQITAMPNKPDSTDTLAPAASIPAPVLPMHGMQRDTIAASPIFPDTHPQANETLVRRQTDISLTSMGLTCPFCRCTARANHECSGHLNQLPVRCPYGYEICGGILGTFEDFISHVQRRHSGRLSEL